MRRLALTIGATLVLASPAPAADSHFLRSLQMLAPVDRLEQLCDYVAMKEIRKDHKTFRPDRAVAGNEPNIKGDTIEAREGAFRSRRKWYELSYHCTAAPDHLSVISFKYKIGGEIPEGKWASYGLWE
jgi:Domain of Unknown Function (DUF930)